jgi:hypothetical protein
MATHARSDSDASFAEASTPWLAGAPPRPFLQVLEAFFRDEARMACLPGSHWGQWCDRHGHHQAGRRHGVLLERNDTKPSSDIAPKV